MASTDTSSATGPGLTDVWGDPEQTGKPRSKGVRTYILARVCPVGSDLALVRITGSGCRGYAPRQSLGARSWRKSARGGGESKQSLRVTKMAPKRKAINVRRGDVEDFRHGRARRKNNRPAGIAPTYEVREGGDHSLRLRTAASPVLRL